MTEVVKRDARQTQEIFKIKDCARGKGGKIKMTLLRRSWCDWKHCED